MQRPRDRPPAHAPSRPRPPSTRKCTRPRYTCRQRQHSGMHKRLPVRGATTQAQARSQTPSTRTSRHTRRHTHKHTHTHTHTHSPDAAGHPQFAPTVPSGGKSWHGGWTSAGHSVEPWTLPGPPLPPSPCFLSPVPPQQPESLTKQGWPSPDTQQRTSPGISQPQLSSLNLPLQRLFPQLGMPFPAFST